MYVLQYKPYHQLPVVTYSIIPSHLLYTVSQKKLGHFFTAYNFRNIEQIFTKLGINHVLFMLNIMP